MNGKTLALADGRRTTRMLTAMIAALAILALGAGPASAATKLTMTKEPSPTPDATVLPGRAFTLSDPGAANFTLKTKSGPTVVCNGESGGVGFSGKVLSNGKASDVLSVEEPTGEWSPGGTCSGGVVTASAEKITLSSSGNAHIYNFSAVVMFPPGGGGECTYEKRAIPGHFAVGPTPEQTTITFTAKYRSTSEHCQHPRATLSIVFTRMYVSGELNGVVSEGNVLFSN